MATIPPTRDEMFYSGPSTAAEYRRRVQQQDRERAAMRADELAAQMSPAKAAEERIRIWERLHALRLPVTSAHALVEVVAKQTRLTIGDVRAEQQRRSADLTQATGDSK
jgi:hypothetical protein